MKSFLWRMRSNISWFVIAVILFSVVYTCHAYGRITNLDSGSVSCLHGVSPIVISYLCCLVFFFIYAKRYTYDEAYFYGQSRKGAWGTALCGAVTYGVIFSCYALGLALLVRRGILSAPDMAVPLELYIISAKELLYNFLSLAVINLIAYETANLLRKFKSWKFWATAGSCIVLLVLLYIVFVVNRQTGNSATATFDFWQAIFGVFGPLLALMVIGDFFMTRGRQNR